MFSKIKSLAILKRKKIVVPDISAISDELCEGLFTVMEKAYGQRVSDTENSKFELADTDKIIAGYARKNMILAAASSIVPGPLGMLGAIPELLLNFHNQMNMIYDLGCANGKENFINKDILLDIPIAAFGGNTQLSSLQSSATDLIDSPKKVLLEKATTLGKSLVERTLKKSIVQFIPVGGPIIMGTWAKMATNKISKGSIEFLGNQFTYEEHFKPDESAEITRQLQREKIKALVNLIEANNEINEDQVELIETIIGNSDLEDSDKEYLFEEALKSDSYLELDKELITEYEEGEDLIMQLVVMAKRSGHIDELEKKHIFEVGKILEFEDSFINDLIEV